MIIHKLQDLSGFGAKAYEPPARQDFFAPETTTGMSTEFFTISR